MALQIISSCKNLHWYELVVFQNVAEQHFASSCKFSACLIATHWSELGLIVMSLNGLCREVKGFTEGMHSDIFLFNCSYLSQMVVGESECIYFHEYSLIFQTLPLTTTFGNFLPNNFSIVSPNDTKRLEKWKE